MGLETALQPALDAGAGIVAVGVFNSGLLSTPPGGRRVVRLRPVLPHILERAREVAAVCERAGTVLPDAAIAFPL